ncbi:hypothetical protein AGMMS4957_11500 [Bacteroidia bacterium]|nr:hypothetical protein AGMMS4957_11500 [Bacteroidia bacterium]
MKKTAIILSVLALLASGCGNKNVPFDYSTLPTRWTELMPTGVDGEFAVCDEADEVRIEGNEITFDYVAAGERWVLEILDSYLINDTIVLNARPTYPYQEERTFSWKFVWLDRERGIAEWISAPEVDTFVTDENLSKFPEVNCFYDIEDRTKRLVNVETKSKNPEDLVSSIDTILKKFAGDLNKDGKDDCVLLTKQTRKSAFVTDEYYEELDRNRRGLVIAFKEGEEYNTVLAIPDCFPSENIDDGGYVTAEIKKGNLLIYYGPGRYNWYQYTFRYRNSDFELIGYDQSSDREPVTESIISINFLTKKKQTLDNTNPDADSGGEVFEETWQDIELTNGIVKLTDIEGFDDFRINSCYVEK